jgi:hypothetical protein
MMFGASKKAGQRTAQLQALANNLHWDFYPTIAVQNLPNAAHFQLFKRYQSAANNCMSGTIDGAQVLVFDFSYKESQGGAYDYEKTYLQTVALFMSPQLALPYFNVGTTSASPRFALNFNSRPLNFPDHPAFTSIYEVRGHDEPAIRAVFSHHVMDQFVSAQSLNSEGGGGQFFVYYAKTLMPPPNVQYLVDQGVRFFNLFKQPN